VSTEPDRRTRKRLATRQSISDAATRLFNERGFDRVTVDEIAAAADVGRMTVFNHFPRKEDLFFDLEKQGREDLFNALRGREAGVSVLEALCRLAHQIVAERRPYIHFHKRSPQFMQTVAESETLKARARAIRDELATIVRVELARAADRDPNDSDAHLAAELVLATWSAAFIQAHCSFRRSEDRGEAQRVFLAIVEQGMLGLKAALAGTPYV
jgi:AcrR family transcriptional regulator